MKEKKVNEKDRNRVMVKVLFCLDRVVTKDLSDMGTLSRSLRKVIKQAMWLSS